MQVTIDLEKLTLTEISIGQESVCFVDSNGVAILTKETALIEEYCLCEMALAMGGDQAVVQLIQARSLALNNPKVQEKIEHQLYWEIYGEFEG